MSWVIGLEASFAFMAEWMCKVFGLIDFFSGRLFYQGIDGRFNSEAYQAFLLKALAETTRHLVIIQDGAKYHTVRRFELLTRSVDQALAHYAFALQ